MSEIGNQRGPLHPSKYTIWLHLPVTHYNDVTMGAIASQFTSLTIICSTVDSDAPRWIPSINGQWRGKCFHLMTSSCVINTQYFKTIQMASIYAKTDVIKTIFTTALIIKLNQSHGEISRFYQIFNRIFAANISQFVSHHFCAKQEANVCNFNRNVTIMRAVGTSNSEFQMKNTIREIWLWQKCCIWKWNGICKIL